jgi:energy-coupling factor transporter transmembrane protein EcfT
MLRRAMRISIALELKAFDVDNKERTFYDQYEFRRKDILFALTGLVSIGLSVLAIVLNWAKVEIFL